MLLESTQLRDRDCYRRLCPGFLEYQLRFCCQGSQIYLGTPPTASSPPQTGEGFFLQPTGLLTYLPSLPQLVAARRCSPGPVRGAMGRGHAGLWAGREEKNAIRHSVTQQFTHLSSSLRRARNSKMRPVCPPWPGGTWDQWPKDGATVRSLL